MNRPGFVKVRYLKKNRGINKNRKSGRRYSAEEKIAAVRVAGSSETKTGSRFVLERSHLRN